MPRHPHEPVTPTLPFPPMPPAPPCGCTLPRMRPEPFSPGGLPAPHGFDFGRWAREKISWLLSLVPSEADADNQLADKAWVEQQTGELGNGKADKVDGATAGNLAALTQDGNLADSGAKPSDFATAAQGAKADTAVQPAAVAGFVDGAEYDAEYGDPPKPAILLKHGSEVVAAVDAADFVIDGMVSNVEIRSGNLVITFNTDSGKQPIEIPLTDIFDPDNYYDKDAVDNLLDDKQDALTFDNAPTTGSNNSVKSGGIWSALWGALSALPTGFSSLYDWCVAQLAGKMPSNATGADIAVSGTDATKIDAALADKASTADATLNLRGPNHDGFSAWNVQPVYPPGYTGYIGPNWDNSQLLWTITYTGHPIAPDLSVATIGGDYTRSSLSITFGDGTTATRTALQGYQLGSQDDKPLASEAEAEALRQGKQDALSAQQLANIAAVSDALAFDATHSYAAGDPVVYNGTLYTFTAAHTGAWTGSDVSAVDIIARLAGKADASDLRYTLPETATAISSASSEVISGETVYYGAATLADRTQNQVLVLVALDELRVTIPPAVSGKVRDFGLLVGVGLGEGTALAAPALVPVAPTGETITMMNAEGEMPTLADGTTTASGLTVLYFTEIGTGTFLVKGEQIQGVA